jgi:hypothetical protein
MHEVEQSEAEALYRLGDCHLSCWASKETGALLSAGLNHTGTRKLGHKAAIAAWADTIRVEQMGSSRTEMLHQRNVFLLSGIASKHVI